MTIHRRLFLLGGPAAMEAAADAFLAAAGGREATIALLLPGGPSWEKYLPEYVEPWLRRGARRYRPVAPREDGSLDLTAATEALRAATGIFIGGGHAPTCHRLYATEPLRGLIRERYTAGAPVAGMSSGALIAPAICALPTDETADAALRIAPGLDLVRNILASVHCAAPRALPRMLEAMARTGTRGGWVLDEGAGILFVDDRFSRTFGRGVYEIVLTDPARSAYTARQHG